MAGIVDFKVNMHAAGGMAISTMKPLEIRIAPALGSNLGEWEWAILEEPRATTSKQLAKARASRIVHANGLERNPMLACYAAICAFEELMRRPQPLIRETEK